MLDNFRFHCLPCSYKSRGFKIIRGSSIASINPQICVLAKEEVVMSKGKLFSVNYKTLFLWLMGCFCLQNRALRVKLQSRCK